MQEMSNQTFQISCTFDKLCVTVFSVSQKLSFVLRTFVHDSAFASCVFVSDILSTHLETMICCSVLEHLLHVCLSWERDPSSAALPDVSTIFYFLC